MNLTDIEKLLIESSKVTNHRHFVIAGSLSILGAVIAPHETSISDECVGDRMHIEAG